MGYFSNGCDGEAYFETWCANCLHCGDMDGPECPVMHLHAVHNYEECNKKHSFLHVLIPRDENGFNGQCKMFVPKPDDETPLSGGAEK